MSISNRSILIVDDDATLRIALSIIFAECGYEVRSAAEGFSALVEIRQKAPDLLLSDLNMPGMTGFELLSVVRRRFPGIRVIAMSGAYSGDEVPSGIAADAFYAKGRGGIEPLVQLADAVAACPQLLARQSPVPIWIPRTRFNGVDESHLVITCPECLRTFPQSLPQSTSANETHCRHCSNTVQYVLVEPSMESDLHFGKH